jgi:hypothetical protein
MTSSSWLGARARYKAGDKPVADARKWANFVDVDAGPNMAEAPLKPQGLIAGPIRITNGDKF